MRALRLMAVGVSDSDNIEYIREAYNVAWKVLEPTIADADHERTRVVLAGIVISLENADLDLDPVELSRATLRLYHSIGATKV